MRCKHGLFVAILVIYSMLLSGKCVADTNVNININSAKSMMQSETKGTISWEDGVIQVLGVGVAPSQTNSLAQASAMSRRAAVVDAYHKLMDVIGGIRVEANTTVQNMEDANDVLKIKVSGLVQGARVVTEEQLTDGSSQVIMEIKLFGPNSLAWALEESLKPAKQASQLPTGNSHYPIALTGPAYTGVIVDARGMGLARVLLPRIFDESGHLIYGDRLVDPEQVVRFGLVDYVGSQERVSFEGSGNYRAGSHPLVVRAVRLEGDNADIVITKADGDKIAAANAQTGFLAHAAVVFQQ